MTSATVKINQFKKLFQDKILFGNQPSAELAAILIVYFVQGILGLARLAVSFFLKDELGLGPAEVAALMGIAAIPWVIKPLFGFLSDGLPLFGYRRRSYLILSGIIGCISWLALAHLVQTPLTATIAILGTSLAVAMSDVIVDSLVVERAKEESLGQAGSLQSLTWGVSALGGLITAYFSGLLIQQFSNQTVFTITATFPIIIALVAVLVQENAYAKGAPPHISSPKQPALINTQQQIKQLWGGIKQKSIWLPTAFVFLWQATPSADSAFFFFTTNELGFQPEFLGRVRLVTSLAALVGIWLYQRYLKNISFRLILGWSTVISAFLGMTTLLLVTHANRALGIDDHWFSLGDSLILTVMGQIAFMPVLVLSARLCPQGVEATFFALLMSIFNFSGLLSQELGALLTQWLGVSETNFDHLWLLIVITNSSTLLPLLLINWLPAGDPQALAEDDKAERRLPPAELYEHHSPGAFSEQGFLPDVLPEFVGSTKVKS